MKRSVSLFFFFLFLMSSCSVGIPLRSEPASDNKTYTIEYLFEHDGCKVYRFLDHGNYVYFTNCEGSVTSFANDSTETRIMNEVQTNHEQIP